MKLNKKHIGQLFDVQGADGSWCYQLVAVKGKALLFYCLGSGRYEIDTNRYSDWKFFAPQMTLHEDRIKTEWKTARRTV